MILQNCVHWKCKTLLKPLKIAFSVTRLRKQFVSCGILMGYHVTAADFELDCFPSYQIVLLSRSKKRVPKDFIHASPSKITI